MHYYIHDPITGTYKEYSPNPPYSQGYHEINNYPYDQNTYDYGLYGNQSEVNQFKDPKANYHYQGWNTLEFI